MTASFYSFENFQGLLNQIDSLLSTPPDYLMDMEEPENIFTLPKVFRRGILLALFNLAEALAKNEVEKTIDLLNSRRIEHSKVKETTKNKVMNLLLNSIAVKGAGKDQVTLTYDVLNVSDLLRSHQDDNVLQLSPIGFFAGANVGWDNLNQAYKLIRSIISESANKNDFLKPQPLNEVTSILVPKEKLKSKLAEAKLTGVEGSYQEVIWKALASARNRSVHDPTFSIEISALREYLENVKEITELVCIEFSYLRGAIEHCGRNYKVPATFALYGEAEVSYQ